ncbi:phage protease [Roseinatronobacter sp. NSM]|uniref:phage protease n=1 Tax=Roseinatronobacter sp. NSM TaxID=3457785 RepID=UPI004036DA00
MNAHAFLSPLPIALNSELAAPSDKPEVPEWIQITPKAPRLEGMDGRIWTMADPEAVVATCRANMAGGRLIPVDFEHATHVKGARGERADAAGWIRELEARDGAIWGRVEWNDSGREAIATRGYRFISPGFDFHKLTGAVRRIVSAGLTNVPNFTMPALNRTGEFEETEMDAAVLQALGLSQGASAADAVIAITKLRADADTALNRAQNPDPTQFVPRADYDLATNRVSELEAEVSTRLEAEITAAIDTAVEAGKIAPSSRDYHLAVCRADGGLDKFRAFIGAAPVIVSDKTTPRAPDPKQADQLSSEELAMCRAWGMAPDDFKAARAARAET